MTQIRYEPPTPVLVPKRRYLTRKQKIARWEALGGCCTRCGLPCEAYGPLVIWDHPQGLWFGEDTDPNTMEPNHNTPECGKAKTAADATRRAKTKRQAKLMEPRAPGSIRSRPFDKNHRPFPNGRGFQKGKRV